ncbi:small GTP-binding protein, putative [Trichomonas vaginalis G3]|uniref:Small GTP-binding protein, putative n=2 Tax=Trichomonas vaginalis TaxID=5722 RepID=A0A8U0WPA3_TRIV3|nr:small Rab GTPase RabX19 [Trichomonas vaginalis G3]AAX97494.1 small Rab GTPase RabX19 [Trichomonas vaginalis]EAY11551.1 small GTP-binding protein, putative [Trichomonas vaginalis G3]KAI5489435.1 small Rab GTPase RabX19 [Trichomonas vaginalis G3]|eukprot:XP_001323774.1 small GTP-binding protein [Trichomonas vaginalis G3]
MSHESEQMPNVKLVLLGESTVGKTSIVNVAHRGEFIEDQTSTIGACFQIKKMKVGDATVKLHLWDTAGQERFRSLAPMYYRDAQYALLIYAIDNHDSFDSIETWHSGLVEDCSTVPHIVLIGNKTDLVDSRTVTYEQGQELAHRLNARFYEVSAKADHESIVKMFQDIAEEAFREMKNDDNDNPKPNLVETKQGNQKKCC